MAAALAAKSSLTQRLMSAAIGLPVLVGVCIWGAMPFVLLTVVLALVARREITTAYERRGIRPNALLSLTGALMPGVVLFLPVPFTWDTGAAAPANPLPFLLLLACGLIAASLWETATASHASHIRTGRNMAYGLLCGAYISLFSGVALLRICRCGEPTGLLFPVANGAELVLLTMASTMAGDSVAYFVGRSAGRHRLAEGLSPRKTTEGLFGGMAASLVAGAAAGYALLGSVSFGLLVGVAAALFGPLGDLFKSALKREIGIKDFGSVIPGHGGVLDRFDSLLFTSPVVLLLVKAFGP